MQDLNNRNKILVDTSVLIGMGEGIIDSCLLNEVVITSSVVEELKRLANEKSNRGLASKIILRLIQKQHLYIVEHPTVYADDALLQLASKEGYSIATLDRELQLRAQKNNIRCYTVHRKRYLKPIIRKDK